MEESIPSADHRSALRRVINHLLMCAIKEIDAFGHRIVHGGAYFRKPVLIDHEVSKLSNWVTIKPGSRSISFVTASRVQSSAWPLWRWDAKAG
jgi:acetate kinase